MTVSPNNPTNPYHLELSDGTHTVGLILCDTAGNENPRAFQRNPMPRSAVKIYQGEQTYADMEPPWSQVVQSDWAGGHGSRVFETDASRYWDGSHIDTLKNGRLIRGPMEAYARGVRNWDGHWLAQRGSSAGGIGGGFGFVDHGYAERGMYNIVGSTEMAQGRAHKFAATATYTMKHIWLMIRRVGFPADLTLKIRADDAGGSKPGTVLATVNYNDAFNTTVISGYPFRVLRVPLSLALTSGTSYWFEILGANTDDATKHWEVMTTTASGTLLSSKYTKDDEVTWASSNYRTLFRLTDAEKPFKAHMAILKNSLFASLEYLDGSPTTVYINGTNGVATAGAATYLRDANQTHITDDAFNGGLLYLWDGPGSSVWRPILDTLTADREIQVADWAIIPTTATQYAVIDVDRFNLVSTYVAGSVTDTVSIGGALYNALGDGAHIQQMRWFYSGGYWPQWQTQTINATLLKALSDGPTTTLWAAKRSLPSTIQSAPAPDCTGTATVSALTWGAAINVGDLGVKITGLQTYGEDFPKLHIFKEDGVFQVQGGSPYELRLSALKNARDGWNGLVSGVNDVYLYFNFLGRIQRYYNGQLDDLGPNLPADRKGRPSAMCAYPGRLYVAFDGGVDYYSTIQCYNGQGWCEVWRSAEPGLRILNMVIQPIPGADNVDRLWFSCGSDIVWLPLALDPVALNDGNLHGRWYPFAPSSVLVTSWMYLGMRDVSKLFESITADGHTMRVWYRLNDGDAYTYVGKLNDTTLYAALSNFAELVLDDTTHNMTGTRIQFMLELLGASPKIEIETTATITKMLATVPHKYSTTITARIEDRAVDLVQNLDAYQDADDKLLQLDTWAGLAGTVGLASHVDQLNSRRVKIEPASLRLLQHEIDEVDGRQHNRYLVQMTLIEVD